MNFLKLKKQTAWADMLYFIRRVYYYWNVTLRNRIRVKKFSYISLFFVQASRPWNFLFVDYLYQNLKRNKKKKMVKNKNWCLQNTSTIIYKNSGRRAIKIFFNPKYIIMKFSIAQFFWGEDEGKRIFRVSPQGE